MTIIDYQRIRQGLTCIPGFGSQYLLPSSNVMAMCEYLASEFDLYPMNVNYDGDCLPASIGVSCGMPTSLTPLMRAFLVKSVVTCGPDHIARAAIDLGQSTNPCTPANYPLHASQHGQWLGDCEIDAFATTTSIQVIVHDARSNVSWAGAGPYDPANPWLHQMFPIGGLNNSLPSLHILQVDNHYLALLHMENGGHLIPQLEAKIRLASIIASELTSPQNVTTRGQLLEQSMPLHLLLEYERRGSAHASPSGANLGLQA